jgi:hypothetical protein
VTQLGDFYVKEPANPDESGWNRNRLIIIGIVLVVIVAAGFYLYPSGTDDGPGDEATEVAPPPPPPPPPPPVEPAPETVALPSLNASDGFVAELAAGLSSHPGLASWLVSDQMVRRFVAIIDNLAEGTNPATHLGFMRPELRFGATVGPQHRYDTHAAIVDSLDPAGAAELYLTLEPLLDEAYVELGYPDRPFRQVVERAISHLLEVPVLDPAPRVVEQGPFFYFDDATLESLSSAQKQLLGTGPENVRTIHRALRNIAQEIGLSVR